jgi:hypothetical protein
MKTLMYVANLVVNGELDLTGGVTIDTYSQEVNVYDKDQDCVSYYYLDSERLGPDKYDFELDRLDLTVAEVQAYIDGDFAADHMAYQKAHREAVARVSELIASVTPQMNELLTLANEFNIPANIKVGKYTNDYRLVDAVDWDSSSMYC